MLPERLDEMVREVRVSLLNQGAMPLYEFVHLCLQVGKGYGVFQSGEDVDDNGKNVFNVLSHFNLDRKIGFTRIRGIEHEYVCLDDASLTTEIQKDIDAYEELNYSMEAYVMLNTSEYELLENPRAIMFYERMLFPFVRAHLSTRQRELPEGKQFVQAYLLFVTILARLRDEGKIKYEIPGFGVVSR